jgi:hypothetical protein
MYLAAFALGCMRAVYLQFNLQLGARDAAAVAGRIIENEMIFRLGMLADIATGVLMMFVVLATYRLLSQLSSRAYLILGAVLVPLLLYFINAMNDFAALLLAGGEGPLTAIPDAERHRLVSFFLRLHLQTKETARLLWGFFWLVPLGVLAYRTRMLPRVLAAALVVNGIAVIANSIVWFVLPGAEANRLFFAIWPLFLGEVALMLWLLVRALPQAGKLRMEAAC